MEEKKEEQPMSLKSKLFLALARAQAAIVAAGKSGENKFDHYKYATLENYWISVQKPMADNGLSLPVTITKVERLQDRTTAKGGVEHVVQVELTGYLCHESGESMVFTSFGEGQDRSDKAIYKAITGGKKYLLASVFNIPTTDDCEKDSDEERGGNTGNGNHQSHQPAQTQQKASQGNQKASPPAAPTQQSQGQRRPPTRSRRGASDQQGEANSGAVPDQNRLVGEPELDTLRKVIVSNAIIYEKLLDIMERDYRKRDPKILSVKEINELIDAIKKSPETINQGIGF